MSAGRVGNPAAVALARGRPVALRPHLSMGLPSKRPHCNKGLQPWEAPRGRHAGARSGRATRCVGCSARAGSGQP
ncbi:hypothetical protein ISF6_3277 [Piscinibacter sakaiensis]|uniref:Uncharacterized protein n=1 Tax=Piscinibacter sakaiensis TaxID=1547922 RepID=A0A0K8P460_PISS1|nr:hypothetical protein ISF6_3277 [Piscinibacter sakaiensis]